MITLAQAQQATGGRWLTQPLPPEMPLQGGAFDTRALGQPGPPAQIFFALKGERSDGHLHLAQLAGSPVQLAVVQQQVQIPGFSGAVLRVEDTLRAMGDLARNVLARHRPQVVAITGSYGKTTAKELVAHVLEGRRRVLKAPGTLNNEIGVPITLLGLDGRQDTCVLEFSTRKEGDIAYLGSIAPPDVAVLLAVGHAHIGMLGSLEAIYRAKGEIFTHLRAGGLAIVNGEDPRLARLAQPHRTVTFGRRGDFRAEQVVTDGQGRQSFLGVHGEQRLALRSGIAGPHGLYPLLVAWAVAEALGVPPEEVAARGAWAPQQKGRAQVLQAPGGAVLVDDTYNASPETVINLIGTLASRAEPRKVLVLGHLAELEEGLEESARLIAAALRAPLGLCLVHAPREPELAAQLRELLREVPGAPSIEAVADQDELIRRLRGLDGPGTVIGFKAARSAHLERAVQGLLGARIACRLSPCALLKHCTDCEAMTRHG